MKKNPILLCVTLLLCCGWLTVAKPQTTPPSPSITVTVAPNSGTPAGTTYTFLRANGVCSSPTKFVRLATASSSLTFTDGLVQPGSIYCYWVLDSNDVPYGMIEYTAPVPATVTNLKGMSGVLTGTEN
ncbi:MAG TPA: hypothetical protein VKQ28_14655 [Candidatus Acidoferrum sp.]|nr:hypothetical protein [Candidatus Acidoferrum sp.]